jgi:esterase/lipase superfamily enzyme
MKASETWHSERLGRPLTLTRWGNLGAPVLVFPTAGGDHEEIERFHLVGALASLLAEGRIKVYSVDSLNGRAWLTGIDPSQASWLQLCFFEAIRHEVVPAIRHDCRDPDVEVIAAGPSIGAYNALTVLCRYPDTFRLAICLSGTYDLSRWLAGTWPDAFRQTSPLHFLPTLAETEGRRLRERFVVLAHGSGAWEEPAQSWRAADVLGGAGVPNRVDDWGPGFAHDWATWREMLPHYLAEFA